MSTITTLLLCWLATIIIFAILWVVQRRTGDAGIVDVAWGACVGLLAIVFCLRADGDPTRRIIVATLAAIWASRLSWHVMQRCWRMPEDGRYVELKEKWGDRTDWKMFQFYQFQAFAAVLFALPMLIAAWNESPVGVIDIAAIFLWVVAIGGESIADRQLDRFRHMPSNKGKVCRAGMWNYSRHPNYFFEWLHWWAYVLLAITGSWGWLSVFAPLLMLYFILKVTGIPPTEKQAIKSRGDLYRRYQQTTSAFFPWFPKSESEFSNSKTAVN